MHEAIQDLLRSFKITAGSRFNAGKRLDAHDRRLTILTAFTSSYVIILTVAPYIMPLSKSVGDLLNFLTVALSIIILISSLIQYSSGNTVKAEQYHRSALEINELRRELKLKAVTISEVEFLDISKRYNHVLQKYSINHDDVDFQRYQLERPQDFLWLKWWDRGWMHLRQFMAQNHPYASLLVVTAVVGWVLIFYAYPSRVGEPINSLPPAGHQQSSVLPQP